MSVNILQVHQATLYRPPQLSEAGNSQINFSRRLLACPDFLLLFGNVRGDSYPVSLSFPSLSGWMLTLALGVYLTSQNVLQITRRSDYPVHGARVILFYKLFRVEKKSIQARGLLGVILQVDALKSGLLWSTVGRTGFLQKSCPVSMHAALRLLSAVRP